MKRMKPTCNNVLYNLNCQVDANDDENLNVEKKKKREITNNLQSENPQY